MRAKDVRRLLYRRPFRPFRMTITTGETHDVLHPEMMFVAKSFVAVPVPKPETDRDEPDDFAWIDLLHIAQCCPLRRA